MAEDASNNGFVALMTMLFNFVGFMVSTFIFSISYISYIIVGIIITFFSYLVIVKDIAYSIWDMIQQGFGFLGYIVSILTFFFNIADNDEENLF